MTKLKPAKDGCDVEQKSSPERQRGLRKNNVWSRDKITRLIRLYRQHECLWNNFIEGYKNKEKRKLAIEAICTALRISKFDFGKKIHNLRNQFNAESKKLERRIEESGGSGEGQAVDSNQFRSRWDHYESLLFLKDVIAPRPGYQSSTGCNYQQHRKIELKQHYQPHSSDDDDTGTAHVIIASVDELDADRTGADGGTPANESIAEDETDFQYEGSTPVEEVGMVEQVVAVDRFITTQGEGATDDIDQKYSPPATMRDTIITNLPERTKKNSATPSYLNSVNHNKTARKQAPIIHRTSTQVHQATAPQNSQPNLQQHQEVSGNGATSSEKIISSPQQRSIKRRLSEFQNAPARDQWDAFGEMVAAEFRNLNSDLSRKKLKRKILQAMLEVGEADDGININIALN